MEKEFVTYDIALAIKQLQFNKDCFACFTCSANPYDYNFNQFWYSEQIWGNIDYHKDKRICKNSDFSNDKSCSAPLWQQVIDFFREEYNIIIDVAKIYNGTDNYHFALNLEWEYFEGTYYEAREAAILKTIEVCQKK
jgi:hypothetical protein